jgi:large subunit ribosomal protein L3
VSQGKGFTGTIKRHNFRSNRASHGNSRSHNVPGSIGMAQDPGRVFPGKKMSGQMGNVTKTVQNLIVARVDTERGLLLVRGAVPGSKGGDVVVTPAVKMRLKPIKAAPVPKQEDAKAAKPGAKPAAKPAAGKAKR